MCFSPEADVLAGLAVGAVAVGALERPGHRRSIGVLVAVGTLVASVLMTAVVRGPIVATCGSLLVSSHRHVRWFGMLNLVA